MTTVFVTGIFDLLHIEHIRFLKAASAGLRRAKGDKLIVGIESDARAKKLKGGSRPIMNEHDRKEMLKALSCVDEVIILPEQFDSDDAYEKILHDVKADIYAVSSHSPYLENKKTLCEKAEVKLVVVHEHNPEYSTSTIIKKILNNRDG